MYVAGRSLTSSSPARTTSPNRPFCTTRLLETERSFDTWCAFTVASDAEMVNADIVRTPSETCQYVDDADAIRPSGRAVRALRPSGVSFPPFRRRGAHGESLLAIEPPRGRGSFCSRSSARSVSFNNSSRAPHRNSRPRSRTRDRGAGSEPR